MQTGEQIFERFEIKYLLEAEQYAGLKEKLTLYLKEDDYGETIICNCYYDTPDYRLIRNSMEGAGYKEKLRLRSYGVPEGRREEVFLELKKKHQGVVYKRREILTREEAEGYLEHGKKPERDSQILREIDWVLHYYKGIGPAMYLSYQRLALAADRTGEQTGSQDLRVTFDRDIRWRVEDIDLKKGMYGRELLKPGQRIMEIKTAGAIPLWLVELLDRKKLYPLSYSKYGRAYMQLQGKKGQQLV